MAIGSFNISKAHYNNETIMMEAIRYVNPKPHPEDVIALIGFEDWDGLLRGHESLLKDVVQVHEQLNKSKKIKHKNIIKFSFFSMKHIFRKILKNRKFQKVTFSTFFENIETFKKINIFRKFRKFPMFSSIVEK